MSGLAVTLKTFVSAPEADARTLQASRVEALPGSFSDPCALGVRRTYFVTGIVLLHYCLPDSSRVGPPTEKNLNEST